MGSYFFAYICNMIRVKPCAKINIGLYVTEKRADGYHNLETVFYPIPITDELEVEESDIDSLTITGIPVAGNLDDNLVVRTVRLLRDKGYLVPPVRIRLRKNIPSGAGLGGGSSDAAFMMKAVNELFNLGISVEKMERMISRLGADCAFFIQCRPVFATGIGDIFTPIDLDLRGMYLVLVKPDDFISTREAYSHTHPRVPQVSLLENIGKDITRWPLLIKNDFEESVFPAHPTVEGIKETLYEMGAEYAAMSGSGSSVFGLFAEPQNDAYEQFTEHFCYTARL